MSWTLRRATAEDTDAMSETLAIGFDGYRAFAAHGWQPPDVRTVPELARLRARLLVPSTWATIAEEDGLVAGHAGYFPQPGVPGSAHLWQLFLRPPWWGTGLATELLRCALDAAIAEGYGRMRFYTPRDQARARAFYEREGFRHTGWEGLEEPLGLVLVEYAREPLPRHDARARAHARGVAQRYRAAMAQDAARPARRPAETVSVLTYRTGVQDANIAGNVHGGQIMKLCDDAAAIAATRLAGGRVVTAAVDGMKFRSPVHVGDLITLRSTVNAVWRTSMEVGVRVEAEDVGSGKITHTCSAYFTMVALGGDEKPLPLPSVILDTSEDERRHQEANHRREVRLAKPGELRRATS